MHLSECYLRSYSHPVYTWADSDCTHQCKLTATLADSGYTHQHKLTATLADSGYTYQCKLTATLADSGYTYQCKLTAALAIHKQLALRLILNHACHMMSMLLTTVESRAFLADESFYNFTNKVSFSTSAIVELSSWQQSWQCTQKICRPFSWELYCKWKHSSNDSQQEDERAHNSTTKMISVHILYICISGKLRS